jgi:hypothetical protein
VIRLLKPTTGEVAETSSMKRLLTKGDASLFRLSPFPKKEMVESGLPDGLDMDDTGTAVDGIQLP